MMFENVACVKVENSPGRYNCWANTQDHRALGQAKGFSTKWKKADDWNGMGSEKWNFASHGDDSSHHRHLLLVPALISEVLNSLVHITISRVSCYYYYHWCWVFTVAVLCMVLYLGHIYIENKIVTHASVRFQIHSPLGASEDIPLSLQGRPLYYNPQLKLICVGDRTIRSYFL